MDILVVVLFNRMLVFVLNFVVFVLYLNCISKDKYYYYDVVG